MLRQVVFIHKRNQSNERCTFSGGFKTRLFFAGARSLIDTCANVVWRSQTVEPDIRTWLFVALRTVVANNKWSDFRIGTFCSLRSWDKINVTWCFFTVWFVYTRQLHWTGCNNTDHPNTMFDNSLDKTFALGVVFLQSVLLVQMSTSKVAQVVYTCAN